MDAAHERAQNILKQHEKDLHSLANELLDKETLTGKQIMELMGLAARKQVSAPASAPAIG